MTNHWLEIILLGLTIIKWISPVCCSHKQTSFFCDKCGFCIVLGGIFVRWRKAMTDKKWRVDDLAMKEIRNNASCRRFDRISPADIEKLVDDLRDARSVISAHNGQGEATESMDEAGISGAFLLCAPSTPPRQSPKPSPWWSGCGRRSMNVQFV